MKAAYRFAIGLLFLWAASVACGGLTTAPTERAGAATPVAGTTSAAATLAPTAEAQASTSAQDATPTELGQAPTDAAPDATVTPTPFPTLEPTATKELLKLEVVLTQIWN